MLSARPLSRRSVLLAVAVAAAATGSALSLASRADDSKKPPTTTEAARISDFDEWVVSVAFSPDGKLIAAGTYENVKLYDTAEHELVATLDAKSGYAKAVAFSPDGKRLAVGSYQSMRMWDVAAREPIGELGDHRGYVTGIAFSPDGTRVATSSDDEAATVWDAASGEELFTIDGHSYPVQAIAYSPDGKLLATAAGDPDRITRPGEVSIWSAEDGKEKHSLVGHERAATGVAFSSNGKYLASTGYDEKVNVYDVETGKALGYFDGHGRPTHSVLFAPGDQTVISAAGGRARGGNLIKFWDRDTGQEKGSIEVHEGQVADIALSPDRKTLASAGYDKTVVLCDLGGFLSEASNTEAKAVAASESKPAQADNPSQDAGESRETLRAGIIGLDTSHAIAFTSKLNADDKPPEFEGCRIVAAYPKGSPDIESSVSRVPKYIETVKEHGVEIVDSIDELLEKVDVVFLETNDGRPHYEQLLPVLKAGKRTFIDKPIAGSLSDAVAIFEASRHYDVAVFSSSSLRYIDGAQEVRHGKIGEVLGCDTFSPCSLEETHPDLFWYGIHGVETLFTVMGTGCQQVTRVHSPDFDFVAGKWDGGRIGTFRGLRAGKRGYGGVAFGSEGSQQLGPFKGYDPLLAEIIKFFRTGKPPVSEAETLEIYAFMEAADESKRQGGVPVTIESVLEKARAEAKEKRLSE